MSERCSKARSCKVPMSWPTPNTLCATARSRRRSHHAWRSVAAEGTTRSGRSASIARRFGPSRDKQIELVTTFADQAVIAIENVRLFDEVRARTRELARSVEELRALGEVSQAVNSTLDCRPCSTPSSPRRRSFPAPKLARFTSLTRPPAVPVARDLRHDRRDDRGDQGAPRRLLRSRRARRRSGGSRIKSPICNRLPGQTNWSASRDFAPAWCVPCSLPDQIVGALVVRRKAPGEFPTQHDRAAADLRGPVGAGDPERAPVRRDRGEEPPACNGERAQVAVRLQHEPRAAHAAQCHHRADRDDGHQCGAVRY